MCLQVFYDKNRAGQHLRNYTGWSLAWWHNYKWATFRILLVFGPDFFGPLFHRLFPDREFSPKKMSVPSATALLSYVRLAYPLVKQNLEDAIKLGNRIHPNQMALLKNLSDLFQYFIPATRPTTATLSHNLHSDFSLNCFITSAISHYVLPKVMGGFLLQGNQ